MKDKKPTYTANVFNGQLKKYRMYRQLKTQSVLCKAMNLSRQIYHLWEKGERQPNMSQLVKLTNYLEVDISYFFIKDADPQDYDLNIQNLQLKIQKNFSKNMEASVKIMPFVETNVSIQLFRILDHCMSRKAIYAITVYEDSGITRALMHYLALNFEMVYVIEDQNFSEDTLQNAGDTMMLIVDNADRLPEKNIRILVESYAREYPGSVVLIGRNMKEVLTNLHLADQITKTFTTDTITTAAFNEITRAALPNAGNEIINLLRMETGVRLKNLFEILKKINNEKQVHPRTPLTVQKALELCNEAF